MPYYTSDGATYAKTGRYYMSAGQNFAVCMTVTDPATGDHKFMLVKSCATTVDGWQSGTRSPETLMFDFSSQLTSAGLIKGASTKKIEFFESNASNPASSNAPAFVNAVCLYKDTLN